MLPPSQIIVGGGGGGGCLPAPLYLRLCIIGQGPTALAVGEGCLDIFFLSSFFLCSFSIFSKDCLKGLLNRKQPATNQPVFLFFSNVFYYFKTQ